MAKTYLTVSDGYFYKIPSSNKKDVGTGNSLTLNRYEGSAFGRGQKVLGDLVFIRHGDSFTPMIKLTKGATPDYRYITEGTVKEIASSFDSNSSYDEIQSNASGDTPADKVEYSEAELKALKEKSGDKSTPLKDWAKGGGATNFINSLSSFSQILNKNKSTTTPASKSPTSAPVKKKILGMTPFVFAMVALSVVGLSIIAVKVIRKK